LFINKIHKDLKKKSPCFPINANHVSIIDTPNHFLNSILNGIQNAKQRIILSSLYLGTGKNEEKIIENLNIALQRNPNLKLTILLDYLRGNRENDKKESSVSTLKPLIKKFGKDRVCVSLYHTPNLSGIWVDLIPHRMNEVIGVQHMKLYMFDNDLLISGANLSDWYFIDRQDRYMLIKNQCELVDFYVGLVKEVQKFSYLVNDNGSIKFNTKHFNQNYEPIKNPLKFRENANLLINNYFMKHLIQNHHDSKCLHEEKGKCNNDELSHHHHHHHNDTWIFPTIQMGQINIRNEEEMINSVIQYANKNCDLSITSAYFNFTKEYANSVLHSNCESINILTASPKSNGFYGSKGLSGMIPLAYDTMEQSFFQSIHKWKRNCENKNNNQQLTSNIHLFEYNRNNWTFHAKGLWLSPPSNNSLLSNKEQLSLYPSLPCLTMIGSSNFGHRSKERDLETQIVLLTKNEKLRKSLKLEKDSLFQHSYQVTHSTFENQGRSTNSIYQFFINKFVRKFL
jgi:CDP-diacylglycerol--glycerol-3-phosphate 3-phosphatidyltransferase